MFNQPRQHKARALLRFREQQQRFLFQLFYNAFLLVAFHRSENATEKVISPLLHLQTAIRIILQEISNNIHLPLFFLSGSEIKSTFPEWSHLRSNDQPGLKRCQSSWGCRLEYDVPSICPDRDYLIRDSALASDWLAGSRGSQFLLGGNNIHFCAVQESRSAEGKGCICDGRTPRDYERGYQRHPCS